MVVRIRLSRWGASHNPFYGIVIANARAPRDARYLEKVGTYNPIADPRGMKHIELNLERIKYWLGVGAQPTERVNWLLSKINVVPPLPKQLQAQGFHALSDPKTWNIQIKDERGKVLASLSAEEAERTFTGTDVEGQLPKNDIYLNSPPVKLTYENIKLDGSKAPLEPMNEEERLVVLKELTGII